MCGIVGIEGKNEQAVKNMLGALSHRGPDHIGVWCNQKITLGHNLLSIRSNIERSKQPLSSSGPWHLSFNGQIYNIPELRSLLPKKYAQEELDTLILFALIEQYGWNFIEYIQGMFAIALYNETEDELRLYRDPSGQKNIYYTVDTNPFAFASEIESILSAVTIPKVSDTIAVQTALSIGYIPGNRTLFSSIRKLNPGQVLARKKTEKPTFFYYKNTSSEFRGARPDAVLKETIQKHLLSKHPIAINLSGGLDSSLILYEMKQLGENIHSYTTRFESSDALLNEDANLAQKLSKDYATDHTEILITSDIYRKNLIQACEIIEEPNYNISLPAYLEVARREGVGGDKNRVVLSGDGGDEVFGGYPIYKKILTYTRQMRYITGPGFNLYKYFRDKSYWDYTNPIDRWLRVKFFFFPAVEPKTIHSYLTENLPPTWGLEKSNPVHDMMLLDRAFWLAGENFIRSDKLYMSESVELRSPLSYQPMREYFDKKLGEKDYFSGKINKHMLRELYRNKLPDYIINRPNKTGWRSPVGAWWNEEYKKTFTEVFRAAPRSAILDWNKLIQEIERAETWPGKKFHLYFSLAVLSKKYNLPL